MKYLFISALVICWLCSACHKEDENPSSPTTPLPNALVGAQNYGWVKARRDGKEWTGSSTGMIHNDDPTKVGFLFNTFDTDTVVIEELAFVSIPLKVGQYVLTNTHTQPQSIYWVGYYDEIDALYQIAKRTESYLWIESYDPATKLITGRFQSFYTKTANFRFNYPSFVAFTDGVFSVTLY